MRLTLACDATFSEDPGPLELEYTIFDPTLTMEYTLTQQEACRTSGTRFDLVFDDYDLPVTFVEAG